METWLGVQGDGLATETKKLRSDLLSCNLSLFRVQRGEHYWFPEPDGSNLRISIIF